MPGQGPGLMEEEKDAMIDCHVDLVTTLRVGIEGVINWLFMKRILNETVKETIECQQISDRRANCLVEAVRCSDNPQAFSLFIQALNKTNHEYMAQHLQETAEQYRLKNMSEDERKQLAEEEKRQREQQLRNRRGNWQTRNSGNVEEEQETGARGGRPTLPPLVMPGESLHGPTNIRMNQPYVAQEEGTSKYSDQTDVKTPQPGGRTPERSPSVKSQDSFEAGLSRHDVYPKKPSLKKKPMQAVPERAMDSVPPSVDLVEDCLPSGPPSGRLGETQPVSSLDGSSMPRELQPLRNIGFREPAPTPSSHPPRVGRHGEPSGTATRFQVILSREQGETFGFKFVSGLGMGRARYQGDKDYYVTKIIDDSVAASCGCLQLEDTIVSVNNVHIRDMLFNDVIDLLRDSLEITLVMERITDFDV